MKLSTSELITGASVGLFFWPWLGVYSIGLSSACSLLWALGGSENKAYRRIGVPVVISIFLLIGTGKLTSLLTIPGAFGVLSIGYGIPDFNDPKGSFLGRFFYNLSPRFANLLTRGTIFTLLGINYVGILWLL